MNSNKVVTTATTEQTNPHGLQLPPGLHWFLVESTNRKPAPDGSVPALLRLRYQGTARSGTLAFFAVLVARMCLQFSGTVQLYALTFSMFYQRGMHFEITLDFQGPDSRLELLKQSVDRYPAAHGDLQAYLAGSALVPLKAENLHEVELVLAGDFTQVRDALLELERTRSARTISRLGCRYENHPVVTRMVCRRIAGNEADGSRDGYTVRALLALPSQSASHPLESWVRAFNCEGLGRRGRIRLYQSAVKELDFFPARVPRTGPTSLEEIVSVRGGMSFPLT